MKNNLNEVFAEILEKRAAEIRQGLLSRIGVEYPSSQELIDNKWYETWTIVDNGEEMTNLMLDLETFSTRPNAAIRSIGACVFDHEGVLAKFYVNIRDVVGDVDPNTVEWWASQPKEARDALEIDTKWLDDALADFTLWLPEPANQCLIWGNGADFDNVILASAFDARARALPWKFYNNRCYRTVKNLFPIAKMDRKGTKHNALDDAISQAEHLIAIRNRLFDVSTIDLFSPENTCEAISHLDDLSM